MTVAEAAAVIVDKRQQVARWCLEAGVGVLRWKIMTYLLKCGIQLNAILHVLAILRVLATHGT